MNTGIVWTMGIVERFAQGELKLGRLEAFSDDVFAIVVTLLMLELKVPVLKAPGSVPELGHDLAGVAAAWVNMHLAFVIYAITPLFYLVPPRWHGGRRI